MITDCGPSATEVNIPEKIVVLRVTASTLGKLGLAYSLITNLPAARSGLKFPSDGIEVESSQCRESDRATPSLRPSIDLLYEIKQVLNPSRLRQNLAQFE